MSKIRLKKGLERNRGEEGQGKEKEKGGAVGRGGGVFRFWIKSSYFDIFRRALLSRINAPQFSVSIRPFATWHMYVWAR